MKKLVCALSGIVGMALFAAEPEVTDVVARQRYPWNGLVDITCTVTGIDEAGIDQYFSVAAVMPDSGKANNVSQLWVVKDGTNSTDRGVYGNGNHHLVWNARADLGTGLHSNIVVRVNIKTRGKVQLWEGGPYWATTNIGAEEPEDYGYYFWWGDTVGYKRKNDKWVASDGSSSNFAFTWSNTPTYDKSVSTLQSEGWITVDSTLVPEHDAAHVHWGGNWRMPTKQELADLNSKCEWTWTTVNGVRGYVVRGKGDYASNSIFLPCAGYGFGSSLSYAGSYGVYWSSVPYSDSGNAWRLRFTSSYHDTGYYNRFSGQSVRPVRGFTE